MRAAGLAAPAPTGGPAPTDAHKKRGRPTPTNKAAAAEARKAGQEPDAAALGADAKEAATADD
eukprot:2132460-Pleurochrysis_carterae.AAC.1